MAVSVLDTSAILAAFKAERGHQEVRRVLRNAREQPEVEVHIPFMALMEVEYQFLREMTRRDVDYWLSVAMSWPVDVVESNPGWRGEAARIKARGKISLADSWVVALALINDAEVLHKDPEFDSVLGLKALRLPYDRDLAGRGA
jgi:predicted nucleic acid-binding protein